MIPNTYIAWRRCIEIDCGIPLTAAFIRERIAALQDARDFRTEQFVRCYGRAHLDRVTAWFNDALRSLEHTSSEQAASEQAASEHTPS